MSKILFFFFLNTFYFFIVRTRLMLQPHTVRLPPLAHINKRLKLHSADAPAHLQAGLSCQCCWRYYWAYYDHRKRQLLQIHSVFSNIFCESSRKAEKRVFFLRPVPADTGLLVRQSWVAVFAVPFSTFYCADTTSTTLITGLKEFRGQC